MIYDHVIKPILFSLDPEVAHHVMKTCAGVCNFSAIERVVSSCFKLADPRLAVDALGMSWKNPIGLAAGFDKDCEMIGLMSALGFSHIEVGTVTGVAQPGNDKPRIFRLPSDKALINRMGFPSCGADKMAERLSMLRTKDAVAPILGVNIGKSKHVEIERAVDDYLYTLGRVADYADYIVVNVSSPNTQGLRQLQAKEKLGELLTKLRAANSSNKPLLVKLAPDLSDAELDDALECCEIASLDGVIATNTTISRPELIDAHKLSPLGKPLSQETGGLSGYPLRSISPAMVQKVAARVGSKMTVIGVGGISTADDVLGMMRAGAHLVQVYTGLVYEGPYLVKQICAGLIDRMDAVGARSVKELL